MMTEQDLTVLLPTLNEESNIAPQIEALYQTFPNLRKIIVVDDNSKDKTIEVVEKLFKEKITKNRVQIILRKKNFGLTQSLEEAIQLVNTPLVGWMDCDLSMPTEKFILMLKEINTGADIAIGSRFLSGGNQKDVRNLNKDSFLAVLASSCSNYIFTKLIRIPVTDLTSGFIIGKTSLLRDMKWEGRHGEYFISLMAQAHKRKAVIREIPYSCGTRKFGKSKTFGTWKARLLNPLRYLRAMIKTMSV